jgi:hypothetical protein
MFVATTLHRTFLVARLPSVCRRKRAIDKLILTLNSCRRLCVQKRIERHATAQRC